MSAADDALKRAVAQAERGNGFESVAGSIWRSVAASQVHSVQTVSVAALMAGAAADYAKSCGSLSPASVVIALLANAVSALQQFGGLTEPQAKVLLMAMIKVQP
jgi:hypothetical protein